MAHPGPEFVWTVGWNFDILLRMDGIPYRYSLQSES